MTKLETIKLCAKAIGLKWTEGPVSIFVDWPNIYDPLHNNAQAMMLVKKLRLDINSFHGSALLENERWWEVEHNDGEQATIAKNADLNRAICETVAKLEKSK